MHHRPASRTPSITPLRPGLYPAALPPGEGDFLPGRPLRKPQDLYTTDEAIPELCPEARSLAHRIRMARKSPLPGPGGPDLPAGLRRTALGRPGLALRPGQRLHPIGYVHPAAGLPQPRNRMDARRLRRHRRRTGVEYLPERCLRGDPGRLSPRRRRGHRLLPIASTNREGQVGQPVPPWDLGVRAIFRDLYGRTIPLMSTVTFWPRSARES